MVPPSGTGVVRDEAHRVLCAEHTGSQTGQPSVLGLPGDRHASRQHPAGARRRGRVGDSPAIQRETTHLASMLCGVEHRRAPRSAVQAKAPGLLTRRRATRTILRERVASQELPAAAWPMVCHADDCTRPSTAMSRMPSQDRSAPACQDPGSHRVTGLLRGQCTVSSWHSDSWAAHDSHQ